MAGRKLSFLLQFVSKKNGWGAACEILILLQRSRMLKVVKDRMAYGERSWGKEHRGRTLHRQERVGAARRSRGKEGGKLNYREEDSGELMSLHLQGSYIWKAQTLCFVSYYSRHSQYSFSLSTGCRGNKRKMTFLTCIRKKKKRTSPAQKRRRSPQVLSNMFDDEYSISDAAVSGWQISDYKLYLKQESKDESSVIRKTISSHWDLKNWFLVFVPAVPLTYTD